MPGSATAEVPEPATAWNRLSEEDRSEYFRFKTNVHPSQHGTPADQRSAAFHRDLLTALSYIERRPEGKEERSIVCGVAFAGPYICVNTRQLKLFLGRCKSSINGSFMEMGYTALRTKSKTRSCVLACMRALIDDVPALRRWTVRCATAAATVCFVSSFAFRERPEIYASDLKPLKAAPPPAPQCPMSAWAGGAGAVSCFDGIDIASTWEAPALESAWASETGLALPRDLLRFADDIAVE
jgi:hypothetical protein